MSSISDRIKKYQACTDQSLIPRLPIVICSEIRNYGKITKNLDKPFSEQLYSIFQRTMNSTVLNIESAIFSFHCLGEINIILNNDDENTWLNNNLQEINSFITSSLSINFISNYLAADELPEFIDSPTFNTKVFSLPYSEVHHYLYWRQIGGLSHSVGSALDSLDGNGYKGGVENKDIHSKKQYMLNKHGIIFEEKYPSYFRNGSACYKITKGDKRKWFLDLDLPIFWENKEFLNSLFQQ